MEPRVLIVMGTLVLDENTGVVYRVNLVKPEPWFLSPLRNT